MAHGTSLTNFTNFVQLVLLKFVDLIVERLAGICK